MKNRGRWRTRVKEWGVKGRMQACWRVMILSHVHLPQQKWYLIKLVNACTKASVQDCDGMRRAIYRQPCGAILWTLHKVIASNAARNTGEATIVRKLKLRNVTCLHQWLRVIAFSTVVIPPSKGDCRNPREWGTLICGIALKMVMGNILTWCYIPMVDFLDDLKSCCFNHE